MSLLNFLNYMRYRSLGMIMVFTYLAISLKDPIPALLLVVFTLHSYSIYRSDRGVTNAILLNKIEQCTQNQAEMLELLQIINKKF